MFSLLLIIVIFLLQKYIYSKEIEIEFISDFINVEFYSVQVTAFLCWEKNDSIKLAETLFLNNVPISIHDMWSNNLPQSSPSSEMLFIIDTNCHIAFHILFMANKHNLFVLPYKWLLLSNNSDSFQKKIDNFDILIDSQLYLGQKVNENEYSLNELFKFNKNGSLINRVIDNWNNQSGFQNHTTPTILSNRRHNIMGTLLIAAAVILDNSTFQHLDDYREKHLDSITKLNFILVNMMIDYFNGTKGFEFYNSWGYKKPSEKFYTGMIGAMQTGDADLGSTSLFVNTERLKVIDFLSWTTPTAIQFVYRQPPLSYVSNLFTLPFSRTVWVSIMGLLMLGVLIIYFVTLWERQNITDGEVIDYTDWILTILVEEEDDSFMEIIMLAVGAVCQQGTTYEPKSGSGKLITFLIFTALLFIYVSYSAYIVVLLQSFSTEIQTLEDLLRSKLDYGLMEVVYNHFYFENATEPIRKTIYVKKILPKGNKVFMSLYEGVRRIREGSFAFHAETPAIYTIIGNTFLESEKCSLQTLQYIEASQFWLPVKKNSSYKEIMKVCLRKFHEFGIQSRESNRLFDQKPKCLGSGNNFVSVGLIDAGPAFAFLGAGFGFAIFIFLIEHFIHKISCRKFRKIRKKIC